MAFKMFVQTIIYSNVTNSVMIIYNYSALPLYQLQSCIIEQKENNKVYKCHRMLKLIYISFTKRL